MNEKKVKSPQNPTNFRLLDLHEPFYEEVESRGIRSSALLRDFVKDGLYPERRLAADELARLRDEVAKLRRELAPIGGNFNQLAHLFNKNDPTFSAGQLSAQHEELQQVFKSVITSLDSVRLRLR